MIFDLAKLHTRVVCAKVENEIKLLGTHFIFLGVVSEEQ